MPTLVPALSKLVTNARFIRLSYEEEPDLGGSGHGLGYIRVEGARSILAAAFALLPLGVAPHDVDPLIDIFMYCGDFPLE